MTDGGVEPYGAWVKTWACREACAHLGLVPRWATEEAPLVRSQPVHTRIRSKGSQRGRGALSSLYMHQRVYTGVMTGEAYGTQSTSTSPLLASRRLVGLGTDVMTSISLLLDVHTLCSIPTGT